MQGSVHHVTCLQRRPWPGEACHVNEMCSQKKTPHHFKVLWFLTASDTEENSEHMRDSYLGPISAAEFGFVLERV